MYAQVMLLLFRWKAMAAADPACWRSSPTKPRPRTTSSGSATCTRTWPTCSKAQGRRTQASPPMTSTQASKRSSLPQAPAFDAPLHHLTYLPMLELLGLLRETGFKVFITTGGGRDFVRVVAEEIYGMPRDGIIGSSPVIEYRDGELVRGNGLGGAIDDGPGKPVHIFERTGFTPVFAGGNADGDIEMLRSAGGSACSSATTTRTASTPTTPVPRTPWAWRGPTRTGWW